MKINLHHFSKSTTIVVIIVSLLLGAAAWISYSSSDDPQGRYEGTIQPFKEEEPDEVVEPEIEAPEEIVEEDPTPEGWTTHTSTQLGLTFAHPAEWGDVVSRSLPSGPTDETNYPYFGFTEFEDIQFGSRGQDYNGSGGEIIAQDIPTYDQTEDTFTAILNNSSGIQIDLLENSSSYEVSSLNAKALVTTTLADDNENNQTIVTVRVNTNSIFKGTAFTYYVEEESQIGAISAEMKKLAESIELF